MIPPDGSALALKGKIDAKPIHTDTSLSWMCTLGLANGSAHVQCCIVEVTLTETATLTVRLTILSEVVWAIC